jgi:hypothetical protein
MPTEKTPQGLSPSEFTTTAAGRDEQHEVVLHRAREHDADDDPDRAGQVAHLRGEDGSDERAGAGDRGKVVAEQHAAVGGDEVLAVRHVLGRRRAVVIRAQQVLLDVVRVEAVGDEVSAHRGEHEPDAVDRFAAHEREHGPGHATDEGDEHPSNDLAWRPPPRAVERLGVGAGDRVPLGGVELGLIPFDGRIRGVVGARFVDPCHSFSLSLVQLCVELTRAVRVRRVAKHSDFQRIGEILTAWRPRDVVIQRHCRAASRG